MTSHRTTALFARSSQLFELATLAGDALPNTDPFTLTWRQRPASMQARALGKAQALEEQKPSEKNKQAVLLFPYAALTRPRLTYWAKEAGSP
jgi:hypothetical protein